MTLSLSCQESPCWKNKGHYSFLVEIFLSVLNAFVNGPDAIILLAQFAGTLFIVVISFAAASVPGVNSFLHLNCLVL